MLSYQHMYHAGCLADVQKHAALATVLAKMVEKDKPVSYMETHAGRGLYDLSSVESNKTREATNGIFAVRAKIPATHAYAAVLDGVKERFGKEFYPGSPLVAKMVLRKTDKLHLMELHPKEHEELSRTMNYYNVAIHNQNGYSQVLAISPPEIRRGFVLIDPSYEVKEEYKSAAEFVLKLHKKWPETVIMLWYPILEDGHHKPMHKMLQDAELPKFWTQEVKFRNTNQRAIGTGLVCVNLPYGVEEELAKIKGWL